MPHQVRLGVPTTSKEVLDAIITRGTFANDMEL
jgi:hypothetical protein